MKEQRYFIFGFGKTSDSNTSRYIYELSQMLEATFQCIYNTDAILKTNQDIFKEQQLRLRSWKALRKFSLS